MKMGDNKNYAIINTSSPFDNFIGKEALDAALLLASYELSVSLIFIGDGVFQTLVEQHLELVAAKDYLATFNALSFYDIDNIYVCEHSLKQRKILKDQVLTQAKVVSAGAIAEVIKEHNVCLRF